MTRAGSPHSDTLGSQPASRLPEAYRRPPRPSSAPDAKASTERPKKQHTKPKQKTTTNKLNKNNHITPHTTHPTTKLTITRHAAHEHNQMMLASTIQITTNPPTTTHTPPHSRRGTGHAGHNQGAPPQNPTACPHPHTRAGRHPKANTAAQNHTRDPINHGCVLRTTQAQPQPPRAAAALTSFRPWHSQYSKNSLERR